MPPLKRREEAIVVLFAAAVLALNYPLLAVFDRLLLPLGIPLLYFYLFVVWLAIIVLLASIVSRSERRNDEAED